MLKCLIASCVLIVASLATPASAEKPNIVWIMADDLGYGDVGCFGQKIIKTPRLDQMAAEGLRFTSAYCGTSVCAPSRASLMTGLHTGHCPIRANREVQPEGQMPLPKSLPTVARTLQSAGYRTGIFGKWGLGFPGSGSEPNHLGFNEFFGYNCQRKAHDYYPTSLWHNDQVLDLPGNAKGKRQQYSHDLIFDEAIKWLRASKDGPFFLYWAMTIPHQKYEAPDLGEFAAKDWPEPEKNYAAMVQRMDRDIGRLSDLLKELKIEDNTLVIFVSDNGACFDYAGHKTAFFSSSGPLRGAKRDMYEGGLRTPTIARWPGKIKAGQTSDVPWAFWDLYPTAAELAGATMPAGAKIDGRSIVPLLLGKPFTPHESFYWELHEVGSGQAARWDHWKAVRTAPSRPIEIYDLSADLGETKDLASARPDLAARAADIMNQSHLDDPNFPMRDPTTKPARTNDK
jgi:arylsulfatase A